MKKRSLILVLAAFVLTAGAVHAEDAEKTETKKQTVCPVMGGKINTNQYADVNGYRIYVCCPGCIGKIKADPEKYIEKMKSENVEPEKTPKKDAGQNHDHSTHQH